MSPDKTVLPLIQEVMGALAPHYQTAVRAIFSDYDFQGADWFMCYVTHGMADKGLTASTFQHIFPYGQESARKERLDQAAKHGFLQTADDNSYFLTDKGKQGVAAFFTNARLALGTITPLPESDLNRLAGLLKRVVTATEAAPNPAEKFNLRLSRATAPDPDESLVAHIDQYVTDLNVYRDDAHLATWQPLGLTGQTWEAFTFVWRSEANTAADLAEQLPRRGYDEAAYTAVLQDLVERGWLRGGLAEEDGVYQVTDVGQKLRDDAETKTEQNYLVGWSVLSSDEAVELKNLLGHFRDELRQLTADEATAVFKDLGSVSGNISRAMFTLTRPGVNAVIEAANLEKPGLAYQLIMSSVFTEPVTAELLRKRSPYSALTRYNESLSTLQELEFLQREGDGYVLTENGRSLVNGILKAFHDQLATLQTTLTDDMSLEQWNRLAELLEQLSRACLNAGDPPGTWCIDHIQGLPLPDEPSALSRIDKVLDDLNAFRDDAHIAAFKPNKIKGHAWELLTELWREQVENTAEMAEKYAGRGYSQADYDHALLDLVKRGWVEKSGDGKVVVTENGRSIREEAETQTDAYFYLPWGRLLPDAEELHTLLNQANESLKKAVEATTEPVPA